MRHPALRAATVSRAFALRATALLRLVTRNRNANRNTKSVTSQAAHTSGFPSAGSTEAARLHFVAVPPTPLSVSNISPPSAHRPGRKHSRFSPHGEALREHASPCPRYTRSEPGAGCLQIGTTNSGTPSYSTTTQPPHALLKGVRRTLRASFKYRSVGRRRQSVETLLRTNRHNRWSSAEAEEALRRSHRGSESQPRWLDPQ